MRATWSCLALAAAAAGCASLVGLKEPSVKWCGHPPGSTHAFCEDFDHATPYAAWTNVPDPAGGASRLIAASDDSAPNLLDTTVPALAAGVGDFTGIETAFMGETFDHVVVGLDVYVRQANFVTSGGLGSGVGFLLVEDTTNAGSQQNLCIGLILTPTKSLGMLGVALVLVPAAVDCITVNNLMDAGAAAAGDEGGSDEGGSDDGGGSGAPSGVPIPVPIGQIFSNGWQHIELDVQRSPVGDGSGTVQPTLATMGKLAAVPVPAGFLAPGYPQLAVGTSVLGPSGAVEIEFDDVTADFPTR